MQPLAAVSSAGTAYTAAQVAAMLFGPTGRETWVFYHLGPDKTWRHDISSYVDHDSEPKVEHDTTRAVMRTLDLRLRGDAPVNPLRDLIQPRYRLYAPDGGYLEWPLGVFSVVPPPRAISPGLTMLSMKLPDVTQLLVDAAFSSSFTAPRGTSYIGMIQLIVSSSGLPTPIPVRIPDPGTALPATLTWEYGTSRLKAINDLLGALSYFPAWADEHGILRSSRIPDWNTVRPTATFDATSGQAAITASFEVTADPSKAYNQILVVGEDPRREAVIGFYENTNPLSPVSTANWHPRMLPPVRDSSIADEYCAALKAKALAQQYARVYSEATPDSLAWPVSQDHDVYQLRYASPQEGTVNAPHVEVGWTMTCRAGGPTRHRLTRIVPA
jgi:hypothetical protein